MTFTVIVCVTLPDVPVMVTGYVFAGVAGVLEQPAATINNAAAPANPRRVRNRSASGKVNRNSRANPPKSTWYMVMGGFFVDAGGTTKPCVAIVTLPVPGAVTGLEGALHDPCGIDPVQESVTAPVKPPTLPTATAIVPLAPGFTVTACALSVKSQAVPVKATACGLPAALSAMERLAVRLPLVPAGGVNVTLIVHVALGATVAPLVHVVPLVTIAKSEAFVPEIDGAAVIFKVELPVFFTETA